MKESLDHLPASKQNDVSHIVTVLREEFERVITTSNGKKKLCRILKIVLFGSHATGDWVKDPAHGYVSDYDILVILNGSELVHEYKIWGTAEDRIALQVRPPLNLLVHTLEEVNNALSQGQYFFTDIKRDGIVLYQTDRRKLAKPVNLTTAEAAEIAQKHFDHWFDSACGFYRFFEVGLEENNLKGAAFQLHQAAERFYSCLLLVMTNYKPATHNLTQLNSLAILQDERIAEVFPQDTKLDRRRFQLLKHAYADARYSEHYEIQETELTWLAERVCYLQNLTQTICETKIQSFNQ